MLVAVFLVGIMWALLCGMVEAADVAQCHDGLLAVRARLAELAYTLSDGLPVEVVRRRVLPKSSKSSAKSSTKSSAKKEDKDKADYWATMEEPVPTASQVAKSDVFTAVDLADAFAAQAADRVRRVLEGSAALAQAKFPDAPGPAVGPPELQVPEPAEGQGDADPAYVAACLQAYKAHAQAVGQWPVGPHRHRMDAARRRSLLVRHARAYAKFLGTARDAVAASGRTPRAALLAALLAGVERAAQLEALRLAPLSIKKAAAKKDQAKNAKKDELTAEEKAVEELAMRRQTPALFTTTTTTDGLDALGWRLRLLEALVAALATTPRASFGTLARLLDDVVALTPPDNAWTLLELGNLVRLQLALELAARGSEGSSRHDRLLQGFVVGAVALVFVGIAVGYYVRRRRRLLAARASATDGIDSGGHADDAAAAQSEADAQ
jgi:hypothetical protein